MDNTEELEKELPVGAPAAPSADNEKVEDLTNTGTLADTIPRVNQEDLPIYLRWEEDPSKIGTWSNADPRDDMYESKVEVARLERLCEAKGARKAVTDYIIHTKEHPEDRSYEDFQASGFNTPGLTKPQYTEEMKLYAEGAYSKSIYQLTGDAVNSDGRVDIKDSRPEFVKDENSDEVESDIFDAMSSVNKKTASVEESVADKYYDIFETVKGIVSAQSINNHAFICGDAGVGKTTTVNDAVKEGLKRWKPNRRHSIKPTVVQESGSIGATPTPLLLFFYKNRHEKIIVLDDCDDFIISTRQDVQNFLKNITDVSRKPVSVSSTILSNANSILQKEQASLQQESVFEVKTDRLAEGYCTVVINDNPLEFPVSFKEAVQLGATFGYDKSVEVNKPKKLMNRFGEFGNIQAIREAQELNNKADELESEISKAMENNEFADIQDSNPGEFASLEDEVMEYVIQNKWIFDSSIVFVSNLSINQLDSAVRSRCDWSEIRLTMPEYLCRAEQILPKMKLGLDSSNATEVINWCKFESFAIFKKLMLGSQKYSNWALNVKASLDFRLIYKITNRFLRRVNSYCEENDIDPTDSSRWPEIEKNIRMKFIRDLISVLSIG